MHLLQRRWRPRGPWRSTGWSGERCQQNQSLWPLSTGETTPWTSLQRFFTHISSGWGSLPRTRLWPNPGEDSTLLNHISWWCTGFGISWDSWGSSRRPLERLSPLRKSGRRSLSKSRTLVSGWGEILSFNSSSLSFIYQVRLPLRNTQHVPRVPWSDSQRCHHPGMMYLTTCTKYIFPNLSQLNFYSATVTWEHDTGLGLMPYRWICA